MSTDNIEVFISYSHDSPEHEARVLSLADRLRSDGINATIDQYQLVPPEGWPLWMEKQLRDAKFVLLVCTETYLRRVMREEPSGKGLGVLWESVIVYSHLYEAGLTNRKFIPVVFRSNDTEFIPRPLSATTYYNLAHQSGYDSLYRRLTDQPEIAAGPIGRRRVLPSRQRPAIAPNYPALDLQPNLVHPYPLQPNFTGRSRERAALTAWLADEAYPVCALVGMGGIGKSALSWYWVTRDVIPSDKKLDGLMWWSFYEGESSFAKFIDHALVYVSGSPIDAQLLPATYDRARELRRQLQTRRVLFVLDGFERQLRAYATLDTPSIGDSDALRAIEDPIAARWLSEVVGGLTRAKVLLSSRLMVGDPQRSQLGIAQDSIRQRL